VADEVADRYGTEWITVRAASWDGSADWSDAWKVLIDPYTTLNDAIWREISRRDGPSRGMVRGARRASSSSARCRIT
jgi:hypothetical protein